MIGHYLLSLTKEEEDRVLLTGMNPGSYQRECGSFGPCLVGAVIGASAAREWFASSQVIPPDQRTNLQGITVIECRFDNLCHRFGVLRVTDAIRSRVLCNQLRRSLAAVRATAGV